MIKQISKSWACLVLTSPSTFEGAVSTILTGLCKGVYPFLCFIHVWSCSSILVPEVIEMDALSPSVEASVL